MPTSRTSAAAIRRRVDSEPAGARERHRNSFDIIRLGAAMTVIVGHAFVLTGSGPAPVALGLPIHSLAVAVFFATSGYLIAGSWESSSSLARFTCHRILRIFPALVAVVMITVFVIGPLFTTGDLAAYFGSPRTWNYLQTLTTLAQYDLPGVFDGHPRDAVNGSLWSVGIEVVCYALVVVIGLGAPRVRSLAHAVVGVGAAATFFISETDPQLKGINDASLVIAFFAGGAVLRIALPERAYCTGVAALVFGGWAVAATLWPECATPLAWLALPYCVVTFGRSSSPISKYLARIGDISYGTYLWGFLVQQIVIELSAPIPLVENIALVLGGSMALGWLSWIIVERPALSLKDHTFARLRRPSPRWAPAIGANTVSGPPPPGARSSPRREARRPER